MATTKRLLKLKRRLSRFFNWFTLDHTHKRAKISNKYFITEEELYVVSQIPKNRRFIIKECLRIDQKPNLFLEDKKPDGNIIEPGNETELVRILNNFVYGYLGRI